jgi:hypothetical protein
MYKKNTWQNEVIDMIDTDKPHGQWCPMRRVIKMGQELLDIEAVSHPSDMTKDELKKTAWVNVLNDDDTFTGLDGCWIAPTPPEVVEGLNNGEYEVDEAPLTRYSLGDLLDWAIDHGYFNGKP